MSGRFTTLFVALVLAAGLEANAQVITKVERRNPSATSATTFVRIAPGPLADGALAYADRTHIYQQIPEPLVGAQYVLMSNKDKINPNHELHVTIGRPGTLYLLIDNRVGTDTSSRTLPPNLEAAAMTWVTDMGFADTSMDVAIDENADGSIHKLHIHRLHDGIEPGEQRSRGEQVGQQVDAAPT